VHDGDARGRLILLCGLPGAGKTTLAKQLEASTASIRLCPDDVLVALGHDLFDEDARDLVEQWCWTLAQRLLSLGVTVIMENGFWSKRERDSMRDVAHSLGASVTLYYLDAPIDELLARVNARVMDDSATHVAITGTQMREWSGLFERPSASEAALYEQFTSLDTRHASASEQGGGPTSG